jgi:serine/threonine-protein kinase
LSADSDRTKTPQPSIWRRAVSGSTRGGASDTESGRAFYQERLAIWAKVGFLILLSGFVLDEIVAFFGLDAPRLALPRLLNLAVSVLWGAAWLVLRRRTLARPILGALDAAIVLVGCPVSLLFTVLDDPFQYYTYYPALIVFVGSVGRALFVPSTARRTLLVSLGIAVLVQGVAARFTPNTDFASVLPADTMRIWSLFWAACAVALATVASRVIYGLRQQVREALQLGQYTLEEKLGEGGMGTVYRARHAMLRRPTAVKLLPPDKVGESSIERFEREVQNTALLSHPNTVAIFDYGRTPDGIFYYAMEFLDGIDLESLVRDDGPQPPARVVHILRQVCGSLSEAHESGLIHRDIKPANIILCQRGGAPDVAKVVDFGLVKDLDQADGITKADTLTGTPFYLSPEAIRGSEVDGRSDLYAVGAVGYYLLCGANVFEGGTLVEICSHHLHTPPVAPSERLGREIPPGLEAVILACLGKDADGRPQSARELRSRLESEGDAGRWTEEQAKAWWTKRRPLLKEARGDREPDAEGVSALSVSIEGRLD